jgi:hypothetical protein
MSSNPVYLTNYIHYFWSGECTVNQRDSQLPTPHFCVEKRSYVGGGISSPVIVFDCDLGLGNNRVLGNFQAETSRKRDRRPG